MEPIFTRFANKMSDLAGRPATFAIAFLSIVIWGLCGPVFDFSQNWQLAVNTTTTITTFLMVFILQNSQNRDGQALQAKLDELIRTSSAENRFMGIEELDGKELRKARDDINGKAQAQEHSTGSAE
ncbi:low affinity iron permease family protein [Sinorhizobium mexicanum]|uniref:Low affinity iron permease family protein n=1 Tax=Sinorhizobium mexicanum TaxID=375549 RepID=A0A859QHV6_9HYPH|nr:low affinity iron permease family protein [Sinorhizobium mexicanum]MBP1887430.1 low affinity Fe/Cu permease [Sinorhizobium mexicanum]QLL62325.1 low affinity iron permease family protein [Sinorhizobium mexicanum]